MINQAIEKTTYRIEDFTVGSTISLTKTQRDIYEAKKLTSKIEEARVERILTEHDNLK